MKKIVDERQEKELLTIEHYGFWAMYWILFATIMYKSFFADQSSLGGEWVAFMVGCLVVVFGCTKKGLWNYTSEPTVKNYTIYSGLFALIFSVLGTVKSFINYPLLKDRFGYAILLFLIIFIGMFILLFATLALTGYLVKKRRNKLAKEFDSEK